LIYTFGEFKTEISIYADFSGITLEKNALIVVDENTAPLAAKLCKNEALCVLKSGEENKTWQSVEKILSEAKKAGFARDSFFTGIGGGVICDLTAFAASIYMRGCHLTLIPTTLLAMVDASVGGKTGFDLFGIKNLAGTFYPAQTVYMPLAALSSLPQREWKNGIAELIKTAILSGDDFLDQLIPLLSPPYSPNDLLSECVKKAVAYKTGVVSEDLRDNGKRMLLNLGHTFAHALESVSGLGSISHGEAVAWGIVRACELGQKLGITPDARARKIKALIESSGFNLAYSYDSGELINAMKSDKKKKDGKLTFIIPDKTSAYCVILENESELKLLKNVLDGKFDN
jgi:3-dehydroquinate synthase